MTEDRDTELADRLAEVGRKVGQALTDALDRLRPAYDALTDVASRPEVRAFTEGAAKALRHRPCLCLCVRVHPEDRDVCEVFDAVISGPARSDFLGEVDIPLCAPCAAARAVHHFS
jgi:hypothetical protein